jgi:hypothetical protein
MDIPQAAAFLAPSYGAGHKWNYALGGAVTVEGIEDRMDRGAMQWAGMPNSYWVSLEAFLHPNMLLLICGGTVD